MWLAATTVVPLAELSTARKASVNAAALPTSVDCVKVGVAVLALAEKNAGPLSVTATMRAPSSEIVTDS